MLLPASQLALVGRHNALNALAALALVSSVAKVDAAACSTALAAFRGLPHRMERIADERGVLFVDDSKATTVAATEAALAGIGRPVVLIAGGDGKGQSFVPLQPAVDRACRAVLLIGRDAPQIERGLAGSSGRDRAARHARAGGRAGVRRSRAPATRCCCRRRARASTSSATSVSAASVRDAGSGAAEGGQPMRKRVTETAHVALTGLFLDARARDPRTMLALDVSLAWSGLLLLALGLVMVYSSSIAMAEASRHTGFRPWYFLLRHGAVSGRRAGRRRDRLPGADEGLAAARALAVPRRRGAAGARADSRHRHERQRLAALAAARLRQRAAVGVHEARGGALRGELHGAQGGVPARGAALRQTLSAGFAPLFAVMVAIGGLLLLEPDFGAFVVIAAIAIGILFLGGLDWRLFAGLSALLPFALGAILVAAPYRLQRVIGLSSIPGPIRSARATSCRIR